MLEERNSLIDDIDWQQKKIERLERENKEMMGNISSNIKYVWKLERENEALREQNYKYCKLGNHIRLKAEMNPGVSRYIDLVNYIDRLEKGEKDTTHYIPHLTNIKTNENIEEPMKFIKRIAKERD